MSLQLSLLTSSAGDNGRSRKGDYCSGRPCHRFRDGTSFVFRKQKSTLFATHFHELVDMLGFVETSQSSDLLPDLEFYCTDIDELEVSVVDL